MWLNMLWVKPAVAIAKPQGNTDTLIHSHSLSDQQIQSSRPTTVLLCKSSESAITFHSGCRSQHCIPLFNASNHKRHQWTDVAQSPDNRHLPTRTENVLTEKLPLKRAQPVCCWPIKSSSADLSWLGVACPRQSKRYGLLGCPPAGSGSWLGRPLCVCCAGGKRVCP